jgi:hypothetical protein
MNYILVYSLSLLLYQGLCTAEQHRLRHYLELLSKPTNRLDLSHNTARRAHNSRPHNGSNRRPIAA